MCESYVDKELTQLVTESPDDIYMTRGQVTFFYLTRATNITQILPKYVEENYPGIEHKIEQAASKAMNFPCIVIPTVAGHVAFVPISEGKEVARMNVPRRFGKMDTHIILMCAMLHSLLIVAGYKADFANGLIDDMLDDSGFGNSTREVGIAGRYTREYFSTWEALDYFKVLKIMNALEKGGVSKFEDFVGVDCENESSEYTASRNKSGKFGR